MGDPAHRQQPAMARHRHRASDQQAEPDSAAAAVLSRQPGRARHQQHAGAARPGRPGRAAGRQPGGEPEERGHLCDHAPASASRQETRDRQHQQRPGWAGHPRQHQARTRVTRDAREAAGAGATGEATRTREHPAPAGASRPSRTSGGKGSGSERRETGRDSGIERRHGTPRRKKRPATGRKPRKSRHLSDQGERRGRGGSGASGHQGDQTGAAGRQARADRNGHAPGHTPTGNDAPHRAEPRTGRQAATPRAGEAGRGGGRPEPGDRDKPRQRQPGAAERQPQGGTAPRSHPTAGRTQHHGNHGNETDTARESDHETPHETRKAPERPGGKKNPPHPLISLSGKTMTPRAVKGSVVVGATRGGGVFPL